jgi:hypothetical protein
VVAEFLTYQPTSVSSQFALLKVQSLVVLYFQLALVVLLLLSAVVAAFLTYRLTSVSSQFALLKVQ